MDQRAQNRIEQLKKLAAENKLQSPAVNEGQTAKDSLKVADQSTIIPSDFLSELNALINPVK